MACDCGLPKEMCDELNRPLTDEERDACAKFLKPKPNAIVRAWYVIRLFSKIVWREWEPKTLRMPDKYRAHYRIPVKMAWSIAVDINWNW